MIRPRLPLGSLVLALFVGAVVLVALLTPPSSARGRRHGRAASGLDCSACHTPASWRVRDTLRVAAGFDHDRTGFPLRAGHARAGCVDCHDGKGPLTRACSGCHVDDHGGKLGQACDACHDARSFQKSDAVALHSRTRLPLTGMHVLVDCGDCHRRSSTERFSGTPSQCYACHEADYRRPGVHPVHDGSRGQPAFPRNCAECHRSDAFAPAVVSAERFLESRRQPLALDPREHDRHFVLSFGAHRGATCDSCHVDAKFARAVRCGGCHAHQPSTLAAQHPRLGTPSDGSCLGCHAGGFAR